LRNLASEYKGKFLVFEAPYIGLMKVIMLVE